MFFSNIAYGIDCINLFFLLFWALKLFGGILYIYSTTQSRKGKFFELFLFSLTVQGAQFVKNCHQKES